MKLELKHLSPYLPYGLKIRVIAIYGKINKPKKAEVTNELTVGNLWSFIGNSSFGHKKCTPILKPLRDIRNDNSKEMLEFEYVDTDGYFNCYLKDRLITTHDFFKLDGTYYKTTQMPYDFIEYLVSQHYDVFGLIPLGLAIDINTIEN